MQLKRSLLNRNLQFPTEVRWVVNSGFGVLPSAPQDFQCPPKSVAASMCNNFHLHLIRDKDWHCAQFSSNCFVVMFTGWQSVTQRCSHWWSAKPSLKTWHLVALFGRNDILPPFLADANESLRSFDSLTLVGGRTAGSANINRGDRDSIGFSRGSMLPFPSRRLCGRGCSLVEILAVGFCQCTAVEVRD